MVVNKNSLATVSFFYKVLYPSQELCFLQYIGKGRKEKE